MSKNLKFVFKFILGSASPSDIRMSNTDHHFDFAGIDLKNFPSAKIKLDEFFHEWLSLDATREFIGLCISNSSLPSTTSSSAQSSSSSRSLNSDLVPSISIVRGAPPPRSPIKVSPKKRTHEESLNVCSAANTAVLSINTDNRKAQHDADIVGGGDTTIAYIDCSESPANTKLSPEHSRMRRSNFDSIPVFYQKGQPSKPRSYRVESDQVFNVFPASNSNFDLPFTFSSRRLKILMLYFLQLSSRLPDIEAAFRQFPGGVPADRFVHITKRLCGIYDLVLAL